MAFERTWRERIRLRNINGAQPSDAMTALRSTETKLNLAHDVLHKH